MASRAAPIRNLILIRTVLAYAFLWMREIVKQQSSMLNASLHDVRDICIFYNFSEGLKRKIKPLN